MFPGSCGRASPRHTPLCRERVLHDATNRGDLCTIFSATRERVSIDPTLFVYARTSTKKICFPVGRFSIFIATMIIISYVSLLLMMMLLPG